MSGRDALLAEEVACVLRELNLRKRVYPRLVRAGRMAKDDMDKEIAVMARVFRRLSGQRAEAQQLVLELKHG